MKTLKTSLTLLCAIAISSVLIAWLPASSGNGTDSNENTIVLLKFKAQPEKGAQTVSELNSLIENVQKEPNFVSIKMHIDPNDDTNILLYEEWEDANYYNGEHMNTDHIKAFMENSRNFLTGPPDITFWKLEKVFQ
jgi:quinol monooxygenase YgiN